MPSVRIKRSTYFARQDASRQLSSPSPNTSASGAPEHCATCDPSGASKTLGGVHAHVTRRALSTSAQRSRAQRGSIPWRAAASEGAQPSSADAAQPDPGFDLEKLADADEGPSSHLQLSSGFTDGDHDAEVVEHLDVIDPGISTISNLTHTANSLLLPPIISIKPAVTLLPPPGEERQERKSIYEDELDRHVEDVLDRRQVLKRTLKGVWTFLKTPLGFVMAIYAFNVAFWGAGIVFFLGKIINLHNAETQGYWVELCCQIETGLFTLTSVGLLPWRVLDTWRVFWIWRYKVKTRHLRASASLPTLVDEDDLPDPMYDENYDHVLSEEEQADLHYQQQQFMYSQTWYRPHGTETHRAFSINTALLICLLNDGNSLFQIGLCACMWGLNRFERPAATTGTLLPASFLCGIGAALCIWRGSERTKRTAAVAGRLRAALASAPVDA